MKDNKAPFTPEEIERLQGLQGVAEFFFGAADQAMVGELRAQVRRKFMRPPTIAERLRDLLTGYAKHRPIPEIQFLNSAAEELDRLAKMFDLRPISELRQEAFGGDRRGNSSPNRWVILWGPSGYSRPLMRCAVGRVAAPDHKFAGRYVRHDGEWFTDDGPEATHFSELPDAVFSGIN